MKFLKKLIIINNHSSLCSQSPDENDNYTEYDGYIDMGKELSMLHSQIEATLEKAPQVCRVSTKPCPLRSKVKTAICHSYYRCSKCNQNFNKMSFIVTLIIRDGNAYYSNSFKSGCI